MKLFTWVVVIAFISCGIPKANYEELRDENEMLKNEMSELEKEKEELAYLNSHSQVVLANTEVRSIKSVHNGQEYKIKIKLPRGYDTQSAHNYPVLYVTDAETNFGGVTYIVQRLIKDHLIPPMLVVGIAYGTDYRNFYRLRSRDLTPIENKDLIMGNGNNPDPTGGADDFCKFISEELFPFIEANYQTKNDDRAIYGHSFGGLFGSYVLLNKANLFNRYLLLGPSLWFSDNLLLDEAKKAKFNLAPTKLYMGSGELEGRIDELQTEFVSILESRTIKNLDIKSEVIANETHRTIFGVGFTNGMRFIYSDNK